MNNLYYNSMTGSGEFKKVSSALKKKSAKISVSGPADTQKIHLTSCLLKDRNKKGIYITYNEYEAKKAFEDFRFFFDNKVLRLPYRELMLYEIEVSSRDSVYDRLETLSKVSMGDYKVLVISVDAYTRKLMPSSDFKESIVSLKTGEIFEPEDIIQKLIYSGYERTEVVEKKGEFASRGGITDIYPVNHDNPLRVEFFGDEIDSMRFFDVDTQRSDEKAENVFVAPAEEILFNSQKTDEYVKSIRNALENVNSDNIDINKLKEIVNKDVEKIENDIYIAGMDRYSDFFLDNPVDISDYTGNDCLYFIDDYNKCMERFKNIHLEYSETITRMIEDGTVFPQCQNYLFGNDDFANLCDKINQSVFYSLFTPAGNIKYTNLIKINAKSVDVFESRIDYLINDLRNYLKDEYLIIVAAGSKSRVKSLSRVLGEHGIGAISDLADIDEFERGHIYITQDSLNRGFEYVDSKIACIALKDTSSRKRKKRKKKPKKKTIDIFTDLNPMDYVVHDTHGVGKYTGIEQLVIDNVKKDYLKIVYRGDDTLYLPVNQLDLIQKYVGPEGKTPRLNSLGGKEWTKTKNRVKKSLREIAKELVKLYAKRQSVKGFQFSKDTVWQTRFEEAFPYTETDDQLKCIEEVKKDMESPIVMDRLLCGDVGYGKTEVALRAMFKAVMDGKQVAYLVPTTVLAQQQYENFKARFEEFPVNVEMLSRFRTPAQQKRIVKNLKAGVLDVIVGTHRLLSKDIKFKDPGLLVIDEEQRFGVEHKEKVKKDFEAVDVLTLTATPIPRTLHMSMTGIRDISVIEDPPEERHPIRTYVLEHDLQTVKDAIYREIARGGQVFYLYNRVRGIESKRKQLKKLLPGVNICVAHGQMPERKLEDRMNAFLNGEYEILLCTTIIESGLDMPNVNTLIVENADKMGLAQLYQIRGRVGRSNRIAYAYITYKKDMILSQVAEKRLEAIREFTDFGAGFKIAMRDMEIRGAGNLLGYQQHGHMDVVGYDMYCKLLDRAVREIKGEAPKEEPVETVVDININAYIGSDFIKSESIRIELYKKIASVADEEDVSDIIDEMIDRFGDIPDEVNNLVRIALIRKMASDMGLKSIERKKQRVIFSFGSVNKEIFSNINKLTAHFKGRFMFDAGNKPSLTLKLNNNEESVVLNEVEKLVKLLHDN